MKNWLIGALFLSAVPVGAVAQSCAFAPEILAAADRILEVRPQMPRILQTWNGADAVYFKLKYEGLETENGLMLIERIASELNRQPHRFEWMTEAYVIAKLGVDEELS